MISNSNINKGAIALGTILKALLVLFALAGGYWYFAASRLPGPVLKEGMPGPARPLPPASQPPPAPGKTEGFPLQGISDEPAALSGDVNALDLVNLDAEIDKIGTEFGGL